MITIAKLHAEWAAKIIPPGAPQVQRQEMERAFYSGFFQCLAYQLQYITDDKVSDEEGAAALGRMIRECDTYFRTLGKATHDISRS